MLSDEEVRQHRLAADGCNLNGCSHVEALLSDRAELVAEIDRLRAVVEAARELMAARGPHIEGSVPLKNALAALDRAREGDG